MITDSNTLHESLSVEAKVCIVGGGAAGIVLATELSKKISNVVLLESGDENYDEDVQSLYSPAVKPEIYPDPSYSRLRFLGGATNHWANNTSPFDPIDFEKRDWVPNSGWPISFEDIAPYYLQAANYCGTQQDGYAVKWWANELGLGDAVDSSSFLETGIAKAAIPPVRFFNAYGDNLKKSSSLQIYKNANLVDVDFDTLKNRISEIHFKPNVARNVTHHIRASIVIFSMGGMENARMLLHFNRKHGDLLGNQGDNVGRYFMDHPLPRAAVFYPYDRKKFELYEGVILDQRRVLGFLKLSREQQIKNRVRNIRMPLAPRDNYTLSDGISSYHILQESLSEGDIPEDFGAHLSYFFSEIDMVGEAVSRRVFGKKMLDYAEEFGGYQIPMMMEQSPNRNNRISLSDIEDRNGIPKLIVNWQLMNEDKEQLWKALEVTARGLGALSLGRMRLLREREDRIWESQLGFGNHHMGTTRMAATPDNGVVDRNLKVFGTNNLYLAGSSVFTTGGHVPPTLTIVALSIRLAEHIGRELS